MNINLFKFLLIPFKAIKLNIPEKQSDYKLNSTLTLLDPFRKSPTHTLHSETIKLNTKKSEKGNGNGAIINIHPVKWYYIVPGRVPTTEQQQTPLWTPINHSVLVSMCECMCASACASVATHNNQSDCQ